MKQSNRRLAKLNNNGKDRDILLFIAEAVADNSAKLSWLIGTITIAIALLIALIMGR